MQVGINTFLPKTRPYGDLGPIYFRRVIDAVRALQPETRFAIFTGEHNGAAYEGYVRVPTAPPPTGLGAMLRGHAALADNVARAKLDVLLSPIDAPLAKCPVPQVLYALDLTPWEPEPGQHFDPKRKDTAIGKACAAARAVIAPSEYVRRRCGEFFDAPLDRIAVAPPGVTPVFRQPQNTFVETPYIVVLIDALTAPHMARLREAMVQLQKELPHTFVVVGPQLEPEEPDHWGPRVVRIEHCPDNHLAGLYQHGALMLYPALHDGTGLRVLEAIYAATPVVTPKTGAIPEYAGDAPVYYNPESTGSMLQSIRRVIAEKGDARENRMRLGQRHAATHTWEKCAWKVLSAIKRA